VIERAVGRLALSGILAVGLTATGVAQTHKPAPSQVFAWKSQALLRDPAVRVGRLPNGLTYYIRKNGRPEKRVSLRLAVQAGSVLEEDDQRGLAHFLEHMAFNGSANFKPGELVSYLESIGARFGADANAYTSFDETVYMLEVPTDKPGLVDKGLLALGDFAARATLSDAEVEKERGVVLEEWRLGQGAGSRMLRKQLPVLFHGSRYAERLPIGTPEVLRSVSPQRIRDFARAWYRPDRMAVVMVGDLDPAQAEDAVRKSFADIPARTDAGTLPRYAMPPHRDMLVAVATDREARGSSVSLMYKRPLEPDRTVADYRRALLEQLFHGMVNDRLDEVARRPDAPFLGASSSGGTLGRDTATFTLAARVADGATETGLRALMIEAERVRRHGFTAAELERAKKWMLAGFDKAWQERDKTESGSFAREYVGHFLEGEPFPGIEEEYRLARELAPGITLAEVGELTATFIRDESRVVLAAAPEKEGLAPPTEAGLRRMVADAAASAPTPWLDLTAGRELMDQKPQGGRVAGTRRIEELGVTILTLGNGVEVWLKPTDFKNDEVLFRAYARGGTSLAAPDDVFEATLAPAVTGEEGYGGFTPVELDKLLAGKLLGVSPFIGQLTHGISGSSTPKDLETALQMAHLVFTRPNDRPAGFEVLRKRLESALANRASDPGSVYSERVLELNTLGHPLYRPLRPADVPGLDRAASHAFYRDRFANAADFVFFFVGAFKADDVAPLAARYLGTLPSTGKRTSSFRDPGLRFPAAVETAEVRKGQEPKSHTTLTFFADTGLQEMEIHRARAAARLLNSRLREILREDMSGTYGASVSYSGTEPLGGYGTMSVGFGSAPENVGALVGAVRQEVARLQREGPSDADLQKVQEVERRELETALRQNAYWLGSLLNVHLLGWDPLTISRRMARTDGLTRESLQEAFRRYFPAERHTVVTLYPESGPPAAAPAVGAR
jgi:zinc protease